MLEMRGKAQTGILKGLAYLQVYECHLKLRLNWWLSRSMPAGEFGIYSAISVSCIKGIAQ